MSIRYDLFEVVGRLGLTNATGIRTLSRWEYYCEKKEQNKGSTFCYVALTADNSKLFDF